MISEDAITQVLDHVLPHIYNKKESAHGQSFILGLSGLQGSGKSTWAAAVVERLTTKHNLHAIAVSLDEFYWPHEHLIALRRENPDNNLWKQRGQPGTHDEELAQSFFQSLQPATNHEDSNSKVIAIPAFDKSKFNGEGDRVPPSQWQTIPASPPLDVVVFEGWCLGFLPISDKEIEAAWIEAEETMRQSSDGKVSAEQTSGTLADHKLTHLFATNASLARYCDTFMGPTHFDGMVALCTSTLANVYRWRLDQEHAMRKRVGTSMSDEEVVTFVRGYMPAYEIYLERFSTERFFDEASGKIQLRVDLDADRSVRKIDIVA